MPPTLSAVAVRPASVSNTPSAVSPPASTSNSKFKIQIQTGGPDYGGYDVDVTKAPSGATVGLGGPPPAPGGGTTGGGGGAASNASSPSPSPSGSSPSPSPPPISGRRRRLSQVVVTPGDDELDAFRRGPARKACAEAAAAAWRFSFPPKAVDTAAWLGRVGGADVVDIVAEAAALLK